DDDDDDIDDDADDGNGSAGSGNRNEDDDPLVFDLNGDGVEFINLSESNALFDMDGSGTAVKTAWIGSDDGFLVLDKNGDGNINDINELFGSPEMSGMEELAAYDSNSDGVIDGNDEIFDSLEIWRDLNGDGVSQGNELAKLADYNIESISLNKQVELLIDGDGRVVSSADFTKSDGSTGTMNEVLLRNHALYSQYVGEYELAEGIDDIPNINGYGRLPDLHIAISLNSDLLEHVKNTVEQGDLQKIRSDFESILFEWAGVKDIAAQDIDPNSLITPNNDTRSFYFARADIKLSFEQLGVIKAYTGRQTLNIGDGQGISSVTGEQMFTGEFYQRAWDTLYHNLFTKFVVGSGMLEGVLTDVSYDADSDSLRMGSALTVDEQHRQLFNGLSFDDKNAVTNALLAELVLNRFDSNVATLFSGEPSEIATKLGIGIDNFNHLIADPIFGLLADKPVIYAFNGQQGTNANEYVAGSDSDDLLVGKDGNDYLAGLEGNDVMQAGHGNDVVYGGSGNDQIS
ncbi:MAG: hypothetical protein RPT25_01625, partial [Cycloclasticus sp.]